MKAKVVLPIFMAGECFERAWGQVRKEAWWTEDEKNADIDAVIDADMEDKKRKVAKNPENPTGNKTIQRVIDRVRNDPTPKPLMRQIGGEPKPGESMEQAIQRKLRGSAPLSPFEAQQRRNVIYESNARRRRGESPPTPPNPPELVTDAEYRKRREKLKSETLRNLFDKVKKD